MRHNRVLGAMLVVLVAAGGCDLGSVSILSNSEELTARAARLADSLANRDSTAARHTPIARWVLPAQLNEISGLALTPDGRLFVHGDETGDLMEIDYRRGVAIKHFSIGLKLVRDDFEAITIVNDVFYMLTSKGVLYEFREGEDETRVDYVTHDTGLAKECEFEGVAYDSTSNSLVLACKNVLDKNASPELRIYKWSLDSTVVPRISTLSVPLTEVVGGNNWKSFRPSDITIDPITRNYVLVASQERALVQITQSGQVVFARPLERNHEQSEGVAVTADGILLISDEVGTRPASITLYRWP